MAIRAVLTAYLEAHPESRPDARVLTPSTSLAPLQRATCLTSVDVRMIARMLRLADSRAAFRERWRSSVERRSRIP